MSQRCVFIIARGVVGWERVPTHFCAINDSWRFFISIFTCGAWSLIDPAINHALRIVTGCLRPTPADNLPILAGIQPAELHRNGATLSLARRAMEPGYLLHSALTCSSSANARRLKSRHPFVPAAQQLICLYDNNTIRTEKWADHQCNANCDGQPCNSTVRYFQSS